MDHIGVLKRAWHMTWRYRVLWVFGIILALTTSRGGSTGGGQYNFNGDDFISPGGVFSPPHIPPEVIGVLVGIGLAMACFLLILMVVAVIARYVAETALIRLVDDHEETGEKRSIRQGFRLGWSRAAWRIFVIDLLIGIPVVLAFMLLFLLSLAPLLLWATGSTAAGIMGTVATVGLFFLFIFLAIAVLVVITLLLKFFHRACALEDRGVIDSIKVGYGVVRRHLGDVAIVWLLMVGVGIGLAIVMFLAVLLLIALAVMLTAVPALLAGGLASLAFEGPVPWILAAVAAVPIFILVMMVPLLFLGGLIEVFKSSVWTLTYREARALEGEEPESSELAEAEEEATEVE
jgi:hypothetical protein